VRNNLVVVNGSSLERHHIDIAEDSGHPPLILVFEVRAVRPLVNTRSKSVVFSTGEVLGDIEFAGVTSALAVSDLFAVDVNMESAVYTFEAYANVVPVPFFGHFELTPVRSGGILVRYIGWRDGERVIDICVMRTPVALPLPVTRDFDGIPSVWVDIIPLWRFKRCWCIIEVPVTIETFILGLGFAE